MRRILVFPVLLCIAAIIVVLPSTWLGDAANRLGRRVVHWTYGPDVASPDRSAVTV